MTEDELDDFQDYVDWVGRYYGKELDWLERHNFYRVVSTDEKSVKFFSPMSHSRNWMCVIPPADTGFPWVCVPYFGLQEMQQMTGEASGHPRFAVEMARARMRDFYDNEIGAMFGIVLNEEEEHD